MKHANPTILLILGIFLFQNKIQQIFRPKTKKELGQFSLLLSSLAVESLKYPKLASKKLESIFLGSNISGGELCILSGTTQMNHRRRYHACGIMRSEKHNGRPLLVAAASNDGTGAQNCEFYDYTKANSQWQLYSKFKSSFLVQISSPNGTTAH